MKSVLVVAAEAFEFAGILRHCCPVRKADWGIRFGRIAELNGMRLLLAAHGPGPELAGTAADAVYGRETVDAVVSVGLCGGLEPALGIGDVVVATDVNGMAAGSPLTSREFRTGSAVSVNRVAMDPEEKARLRQTGASIVEMEARAIAERAAAWGKPFYCVRTVSDRAADGFLLDLNSVRDAEGRFRTGKIIAKALARPFLLVPELLRLKRNSEYAAERLGDFVADCCF